MGEASHNKIEAQGIEPAGVTVKLQGSRRVGEGVEPSGQRKGWTRDHGFGLAVIEGTASYATLCPRPRDPVGSSVGIPPVDGPARFLTDSDRGQPARPPSELHVDLDRHGSVDGEQLVDKRPCPVDSDLAVDKLPERLGVTGHQPFGVLDLHRRGGVLHSARHGNLAHEGLPRQ